MPASKFIPPTFRHMIIAGVILVVVLIALANSPQVFKTFGSLFLYIPHKLGLIKAIAPQDVYTVPLSSSPLPLKIAKSGRYAMYTDNTDFLLHNQVATEPWLAITSQTTSQQITISFVQRGIRLYDTPLVKGRPVLTFQIDTPGNYEIWGPVLSRPAIISIVPDYTTGQELTLTFVYLAQISLVIVPIIIVYYWRYQARSAVRRAEQEQKRKQSDAFWEAETKRVKKG